MGYPTTDVVYGLKEGGAYQNYQGGAIIWTPAIGARLSVGAVRDAWASTGFEHGTLGFPTTDEYDIPGGVAQDYQGGVITATAAGTFVVNGAIFRKHDEMGRMLGFAVSPQAGIRDGGVYQNFQHGAILWSPATGAHVSVGVTRGAWALTGFENGVLGYPTTDEIPVKGGFKQNYQGGAIYWTASLGAYSVATDYNAMFEASGGLGTLGFPATNRVTGLKDSGSYQNFQNGALISSPAAGIHVSIGATRDAWAATGFEGGRLGYPTTNNYVTADGSTVQDYQGGRITIAKDGTSKVEYGGVSGSQ